MTVFLALVMISVAVDSSIHASLCINAYADHCMGELMENGCSHYCTVMSIPVSLLSPIYQCTRRSWCLCNDTVSSALSNTTLVSGIFYLMNLVLSVALRTLQ